MVKKIINATLVLSILMVAGFLFNYFYFYESRKAETHLQNSNLELASLNLQSFRSKNLLGQNISIAVLDTGIDKTHNELKDRVFYEACFSSNTNKYQGLCKNNPNNDQNTDFGLDSGLPCQDELANCDHGTAVAGLISGKYGIAPQSKLLSFQVYSRLKNLKTNQTTDKIIIQKQDYQQALIHILGLIETKQQKIDIVNLSFNTEYFAENYCDNYDPILFNLVNKLIDKNVIVINSSGNNGFNGFDKSSKKLAFPSCLSNIISVGSIDNGIGETKLDDISDFSNNSSVLVTSTIGKYLSVAVPDDIDKNKTVMQYGTSLSAGIMSGLVAIMKQENPNLNQNLLLQKLRKN